ncbi:MarR family transcriptional regulator [Pseudovibrio exalbescens]|uniref:MarR family winged helix-turn-helix transcriptional regulator n=1 Tax=Pseudovibrio exalbescens TaxID=197461 RepID=UPI00236701F8|nr:MarR family transcriptional regulator [Pseudovibrio exalbescens]MDD7910171.1 MarR family transcriptional regulator [Pseudovibrio exalbescens]
MSEKNKQQGLVTEGCESEEFQRLALDSHLCFAIYKANHAFNRFYKPLMKELGITYPQYITLLALLEKDGQRVSDLGETLFLESNTLTPLLKRLEEMGLVKRKRSAKDERQVIISLTAQGRALGQGICEVQRCAVDGLEMSMDDVQHLVRELNRVQEMLVKAGR